MNFSVKTKNEIIKRELDKSCCKIAALSGFLRTSGSVETRNGKIGFSAIGEVKILNYFSKIISSVYKINAKIEEDGDKETRAKMSVVSDKSLKILLETGIIKLDTDGSLMLELAIVDSLFKDDYCKTAFVIGAFLGSGTVTVPQMTNATTTGYHLEFVFSQYATASDFSALLASFGFMNKLIERKESFVVYIKNAESVNDILTLVGAKNASLELTDIIIRKGIKNRVNRSLNCEMSNMNKAIDAAFTDREAIMVIEQTVGLQSLPITLQTVARARIESESKSLAKIAEELCISKSCLSHRLRKLREISSELND